jgi:hypothetical protein
MSGATQNRRGSLHPKFSFMGAPSFSPYLVAPKSPTHVIPRHFLHGDSLYVD